MAKIDCQDCCRRLYNLETGEPQFYRAGPDRIVKYYDGPDHKPACRRGEVCPKGSPETAHEHELTERNWTTLDLWRRVRATGGACLNEAERNDALLLDNLATIDELVRHHELGRQADRVGRTVSRAIRR